MSESNAGTLDLAYSVDFPLSPMGRAMVGHIIERDVSRSRTQAPALVVRDNSAKSLSQDVAKLSRSVAMILLWLTLTGSLGMLLQSLVRERANRALESLLASASPIEIVTGKMLGVGGVSMMILAGWLGSIAVLSYFLQTGAGMVAAILAKLAEPTALLQGGLIYICAFAFYGGMTMALGALARDGAAAQNMVRPMFVLLLGAFFVALAVGGKSTSLSWLAWFPPFTPFLLLVSSPSDVSFWSQVILLGTLVTGALLMLFIAARLLRIDVNSLQIFVRVRTKLLPMV